MYRMNQNHCSGLLRKLFIVSICIVAGATASFAQNSSSYSSPEQLQQEIERLQRMLEIRQQMLQQEEPQTTAPARQSQQPVTLRPVDTGLSVVTFDLGAVVGQRSTTQPGRFQIKTNLLYAGATMTPNLAFEFGLGAHTSIEVSVGYNGWQNLWDYAETGPDWDLNNKYKSRIDHVFGKVEFRYWLKDRFKGHFFGAGAFYTDYRVGDLKIPLLFDRQFEYNGYGVGTAISYGYSWRISRIFAMEFTVGGGFAMLEYDKNLIEADSESFSLIDPIRFRKTYLGPTNAGIKLVFTIQ